MQEGVSHRTEEPGRIKEMVDIHILQNNCKVTVWSWKSNHNTKTLFSKALISCTKHITRSCSLHSHRPSPPPSNNPLSLDDDSTKHTTLLVESFHEHKRLKSLLDRLNKKGSSPLQILKQDGDWSKDHFWAVIRFLKHSLRSKEILQVFDVWKGMEASRITDFNYEKIVVLLCEEGLLDDAVSAVKEMISFGLTPSLQIYNSIIHGYAGKGMFDDALLYLEQMKEANLSPESDTYEGLIQAYGEYKMYDEIRMCLKRMEEDRCLRDHATFNLIIREFARGGLLMGMEKVYQTLLTKKMILQPSTLIVMLEAYANFGIVDKMDKVLRKVWSRKVHIEEDMIRKLAGVYIENYMFSRLHDLANELASRTGRTDIVWCLRLLSHACLLSRKGMDFVVQEMEEAKVSWNVTVANFILLAYFKMKDFTRLRILLSKLPDYRVKPDIVTVGILFDANSVGFDGTSVLEGWRRSGLLYKCVEMDTDSLVITAFRKGQFLRNCEEVYSSIEPEARETKKWTYNDLISLVDKHYEVQSYLKGVE